VCGEFIGLSNRVVIMVEGSFGLFGVLSRCRVAFRAGSGERVIGAARGRGLLTLHPWKGIRSKFSSTLAYSRFSMRSMSVYGRPLAVNVPEGP